MTAHISVENTLVKVICISGPTLHGRLLSAIDASHERIGEDRHERFDTMTSLLVDSF
jgi:hypothetical protein